MNASKCVGAGKVIIWQSRTPGALEEAASTSWQTPTCAGMKENTDQDGWRTIMQPSHLSQDMEKTTGSNYTEPKCAVRCNSTVRVAQADGACFNIRAKLKQKSTADLLRILQSTLVGKSSPHCWVLLGTLKFLYPEPAQCGLSV